MSEVATYHMSCKALFNKLFKSKKCKKCSTKMALQTVRVPRGSVDKWHADLFVNEILFRYGQKVDIYYAYKCDNCKTIVKLEEL